VYDRFRFNYLPLGMVAIPALNVAPHKTAIDPNLPLSSSAWYGDIYEI
jgi:hypothetical protein